jgi:uncharacterized protein YdcH (DUF465 family)
MVACGLAQFDSMTTATASPKAEKIGGQYEWELGADGKYTIKSVEVFSAHSFGENGVNYEVTDDWIDETHKKLLENFPKHMIPVNYSVEHRTETKKHLGFLKPTHTKKIKVNGKFRNTMFGDIVGIEPQDFEDFRRTKYPFRSASIVSFKQHRLRDLSMLREDPGFYEYPLLTLEEKREKEEAPLLAYQAVGDDGGDFLYAFGANDKKKKKTDEKKDSSDKSSGEEKKKPFDKKSEGAGDSSEVGDVEQDSVEGESGDGEDAQPESMTDGMSLEQKVDAILAAVKELLKDSVPSEDEVNGNKAPSQDKGASKKTYSAKEDPVSKETEVKKDADAAVVSADAKSTEAKASVESDAKNDAHYAALADRTAKLEKKISSKENAEKTIAELEAEGYHLTPKTKDQIATYAAKSDEHLKVYVDTYRAHAEKDPSPSVEGDAATKASTGAATKSSVLPDEVAQYAAKNPADKAGIAKRAKLFQEYQEYKASGGTIVSFDRYVAAELNAEVSRMVIPGSE